MARVYLETSLVSYLTSRLSRDLIVAGHQQITHQWWDDRRSGFQLYISQRVLDEVAAGDAEAAQARLAVLKDFPLLDLNEDVIQLAQELIIHGPFPQKAAGDAIHVAVATVHGMDFLLTWNCRHIANAEMIRVAARICSAAGYIMPVVCTPEELMGESL